MQRVYFFCKVMPRTSPSSYRSSTSTCNLYRIAHFNCEFSVDLIAFKWVSMPSECSWSECSLLRDLLKVLDGAALICKWSDISDTTVFFYFFFYCGFICKKRKALPRAHPVSAYLMYFSMNFLWNSERRLSLMKVSDFSASVRAQFLKTTSSFHRRLTLALVFWVAAV